MRMMLRYATVTVSVILLIMPISYVQAQIPGIPGIKEISGRYVNENAGVEITFPTGWSGVEIPLVMVPMAVVTVVVMPGGIKDPSSISSTGPMIMLNVRTIEKIEDVSPNIKAKGIGERGDRKGMEERCKLLSFNTRNISGINGVVVEAECETTIDDKPVIIRIKAFSASQEKNNTIRSVNLMFMSTVDQYNSYVGDFDKALDTLKISNAKSVDLPISKNFTQAVSVDGQNIPLKIKSNSDVKNLMFDTDSKTISFNVEGSAGSLGVTDVYPGSVLKGPYTVTIDGEPAVVVQITDTESGEEGIRVFYLHSLHEIKIMGTAVVPEFPIAVLPLLALIIGIAIFVARSKGMYRF
ncbi:MAG: hypothetical protein ACK4FV_05785 [Candidatus Nitrosocaldus sp.]